VAVSGLAAGIKQRDAASKPCRSAHGYRDGQPVRPAFRILVLILSLVLPGCTPPARLPLPETLPPIEIFFSPRGGCTEAVVQEIQDARTSISVQAYSFTSAPIAEALVEAHRRGIEVRVILDKSQRTEKYSSADFLQHAGVPVWIDTKHAIAHNKTMIIDGATVITGSFNFTKAAEESNAENLLVIRDKLLAEHYANNWRKHAEHSELYEAKLQGYSEIQQPAPMDRANSAPVTETTGVAGYVASKNSGVFHQLGCPSADKIAAKNRVTYATRAQARQAGKKPCDECKP
jgi:hypothetical protein